MLNVCVKSHEGLRYSASKVVAGLWSIVCKVETTQVVELQGVLRRSIYRHECRTANDARAQQATGEG
jgi:hypothetical protein